MKKGSKWESYLARRKWMKGLLSKIPKDELIGAEIGVWKGDFICHLLEVEPRIKRMYAVDPYFPLFLPRTENNRKNWNRNFEGVARKLATVGDIVMMRGRSEEVSDQVPSGLDFITIDGEHSYREVIQDLTLYEPKVTSGGLFCGHDYFGRASEGVKQAVDEYVEKYGRNLHTIEENVMSWWWYKP